MNKELALLDQIEEIRQKSIENPFNYTVDHTVREIVAMVAGYFGYKGRSEWTEELAGYPESNIAKRLSKDRFHI